MGAHRELSWHRLLTLGVAAALGVAALGLGACGAVPPSTSAPAQTLGASPAAVATSRATTAATSRPTAPPASPVSAQAMLDAARQAYGAPGALAVVRLGGQSTFLLSGTADTKGTPISGATRFRIASITKPIVAALVLDAVKRGEVALDDVVGTLVPGVLRPEPPVTVRQLLDHTSGIFDESNGVESQASLEADIAKLADPALRAEAVAAVAKVLAGKPVIASDRLVIELSETHDRLFAPGSTFAYSNTNYQLAAMVLARVTGMSLPQLLQTRFVGPLGLKRTSIAPPDVTWPEFRGYVTSTTDGSLVDVTDDLTWFGNGGNGGIIATADGLLAAMQAIVGGEYLSAELTATMLTPNKDNYGLGIGGYSFRCGLLYGHQGGVNGTSSIAVASRDGRDGVVVAFNLRAGQDPNLVSLAENLLCSTGTSR